MLRSMKTSTRYLTIMVGTGAGVALVSAGAVALIAPDDPPMGPVGEAITVVPDASTAPALDPSVAPAPATDGARPTPEAVEPEVRDLDDDHDDDHDGDDDHLDDGASVSEDGVVRLGDDDGDAYDDDDAHDELDELERHEDDD